MENNTTSTRFAGNIDLSALRKKQFTIDGDESHILELDTSDLSIINRLSETYPKLKELGAQVGKMNANADDEDSIVAVADTLKDADAKMREYVDYIFDSNVCELCASHGSMYDPIGGKMRYEHIIDVLSTLYESELAQEMDKINKRVESHTDKYTK